MINKNNLNEVISDLLYLKNLNKINPEGLLSESIFGPTKNYECSCGLYKSKILHSNKRCPICNVNIVHSNVRYKTFAKIILEFPIINSLNKNQFIKIIGRKNKHFLNFKFNVQFPYYLHYNESDDSLIFDSENLSDYIITGIFSLYISLKHIHIKYNSITALSYLNYYYHEILVLPPECRLTLKLTKFTKKIIKHKIVNIYNEIIILNKYIRKEINVKNLINECLTDISKIKNCHSYDLLANKLQSYSDMLYDEVFTLLNGKNGLIRSNFLGKTIDYSARAVVVNDPTLLTYQIKIPKYMFFKLWIIEYFIFLRKFKYSFNISNKSALNLSKLLNPINKSEYSTNLSQYEHFDEFITYFFKNSNIKERLIFMNRQPTLWRYGLLSVEVIGITDNDVIMVSPLIISSYNMDFDGDTVALYRVHENKSINEIYENSFSLNLIEYDHNNSLLHVLSKENKYAFTILKNSIIDNKINEIKTNSFNDLIYDNSISIDTPILINDLTISYGHYLIHKFSKFSIFNKNLLNDPLRQILLDSKTNYEYHERINKFVSNINFFISTYNQETLTLPFDESIHIIKNNNTKFNLPENPIIGQNIYNSISNKIYKSLPKHFQLYKMLGSFKTQFDRCLISIGYIADDNNLIKSKPIQNNILYGTTENEFFESSYGTRKSLIDKDQEVPKAGHMQRAMVINLSSIEICEDDCQSKIGFKIKILNNKHGKSLNNRYYFNNDKTLNLYNFNESDIGKTYLFRSPITCQTSNFKICKKCVGETKFNTPYIGVLTGQYIEERLTQLTMSSFHTSGSGHIKTNNELISFFENIIDIKEIDDKIYLYLNCEVKENIINILQNNKEYKFIKCINDNILIFDKYNISISNNDVSEISKRLNKLLLTQPTKGNPLISPDEAYYEFLTLMHSVGEIYSIFIEILFTNIYLNENNTIIRYAYKNKEPTIIVKKLNIKSQYTIQNSILGLLFEPNVKTIMKYCKSKNEKEMNNIFEKIWLGKL